MPEHVQAMLNAIADQGRSEHTVRNVRAALRRALNQAMRWGYVARNVATLVDVSGRISRLRRWTSARRAPCWLPYVATGWRPSTASPSRSACAAAKC
jgi:hypothetical protein